MRRFLLGSLLAAACGGGSSAPDGAVAPDAALDAAPACAPIGDYVEAHDDSNDVTPESTGLTAPGTIGGCLLPNDVDLYQFTLGADAWLSAEGPPSGVLLTIEDGGGNPITSGDTGALAPAFAPAGTYVLIVEGEPTASGTYQIAIDALTCDAAATSAYTEANDGAGRGNDMLSMTVTPTPLFQVTPDTTDAPEIVGAAIAPGDSIGIAGTSLAEDTAGDDFDDRDTYQLSIGADARRAIVRVDWTDPIGDPADLDAALLPGASTEPDGVGTTTSNPEAFGAVIGPGDLWLWVARFHEATPPIANVDYVATVCVFR